MTRLHSIAGLHAAAGWSSRRPFRSPHHTISASGLVGGGGAADARRGDARPPRRALPRRAVRVHAPGAGGAAPAARGRARDDRPRAARDGLPDARHARRGLQPVPVRDGGERLPLHRRRPRAPPPPAQRPAARPDRRLGHRRPARRRAALRTQAAPPSAIVRERIVAARERQTARLAGTALTCNAQLDARAAARARRRDARRRSALLYELHDRNRLSARGHGRILRVARTIADLAGATRSLPDHILQRRLAPARRPVAFAGGLTSRVLSRARRHRRRWRRERRACDDCLRRTDLIAALAPWLDVEWRRRSAPAGRARAARRRRCSRSTRRGRVARGYAALRAGPRPRADRRAPGSPQSAAATRRYPQRPARAGRPARGAPRRRPARRARARDRRRDRRRAPRHAATGSRSPARSAAASPRPGVPVVSGHGARRRLGRARRRARARRRRRRSPCSPAAPTSPTRPRARRSTRGWSSAAASSPSCRPDSPRSAGASSPATA